MPTYEYACKACGEHLEVVQSFSDDPLTECPACSGQLRKVFQAVGIAFKGSGFYKNDSRSSSSSKSSSSESNSESKAETKSDAKSDGKSDAKSDTSSSSKSESASSSPSSTPTSTPSTPAAAS
ncbi:MAG TPA: FmdB family zinc ribbon protein [Acidimicrobiales bacterium]|nr:FmdB family zinc ribbon protein [Acidimicrobiales bacterium]